jgi:hypothetical protein
LRFETLPQYSSLAGGEHQRQFINEPLTLSPNDCAIVLDFLRAIYNLERCFTLHLTWRMTTFIIAIFLGASLDYRPSSSGASGFSDFFRM